MVEELDTCTTDEMNLYTNPDELEDCRVLLGLTHSNLMRKVSLSFETIAESTESRERLINRH